MEARNLPESRHFRLESVADGVWAAISIAGTGSTGNAAIVDLGDNTLVFDTMFTPQAAEDLRTAAENLTGRTVRYVLNSHFHSDHVQGNQVFPGADILATRRTRDLIAERTARPIELEQADPTLSAARLREMEEKVTSEQDETRKRQLAEDLASEREYAAALPTLAIRLPMLTFDTHLALYGTRRHVEFLTLGGGHTSSDAFLHLPDDHLALMGDLLFVRSHPWMAHGQPEEWIQILEHVETLDLRTLVPGHGPVGTKEDCVRVRHYIADALALAREAVRAGKSADEMTSLPVPDPYATWDGPVVFGWNMAFLHDYLSEQEGDTEDED